MQALGLLVLGLAFIAFIFSVEKTCKIEMFKKLELDKNGNTLKKEGDEGGFIDFLKSMTPLGLGVSASCLADYIYSASIGAFGDTKDFSADIIVSTIIFTALEIITFIILFYLIYGVLSLFKSHGGNEQIRRNTAGWATVIITFVLIFFAKELGV